MVYAWDSVRVMSGHKKAPIKGLDAGLSGYLYEVAGMASRELVREYVARYKGDIKPNRITLVRLTNKDPPSILGLVRLCHLHPFRAVLFRGPDCRADW